MKIYIRINSLFNFSLPLARLCVRVTIMMFSVCLDLSYSLITFPYYLISLLIFHVFFLQKRGQIGQTAGGMIPYTAKRPQRCWIHYFMPALTHNPAQNKYISNVRQDKT